MSDEGYDRPLEMERRNEISRPRISCRMREEDLDIAEARKLLEAALVSNS